MQDQVDKLNTNFEKVLTRRSDGEVVDMSAAEQKQITLLIEEVDVLKQALANR